MDAAGNRDDANGVRLIVVGTGGGNLRPFENPPLATTVVRNDDTWGVLKLTLSVGGVQVELPSCEGLDLHRLRVGHMPLAPRLAT